MILLLVDGNELAWRAYSVYPPMIYAGCDVRLWYGFVRSLLVLRRKFVYTHLGIGFDLSKSKARLSIDENYKSGREKAPSEFYSQLNDLRELLATFRFPTLEMHGVECDDILANVVRRFCNDFSHIYLYSNDQDMFGCIRKNVTILRRYKSREEFVNLESFRQRFGVEPVQWAHVRSLSGDATDHIIGIPGVGVRTASKYIAKMGDIESLLARVEELPHSLAEKIVANAEQIRHNFRLLSFVEVTLDEKIDTHFFSLSNVRWESFKKFLKHVAPSLVKSFPIFV